jgi:hypothetical protein
MGLAIRVLLCAIPAFLIGYCYQYFFRDAPLQIHIVLTYAVLGGIGYYIYKAQRQFLANGGEPAEMPFLLHNTMFPALFIGSIGAIFWSIMSFRTECYIDNGREKPVVVVTKMGKYTIPSKAYQNITLVLGDNELTIDNIPKKINLKDKGKWIWNIDSLNSYVETTVVYRQKSVSDDVSAGSDYSETEAPTDTIRAELFKSNTDLIFQAPDELEAKRSDRKKSSVLKTILQRVNY